MLDKQADGLWILVAGSHLRLRALPRRSSRTFWQMLSDPNSFQLGGTLEHTRLGSHPVRLCNLKRDDPEAAQIHSPASLTCKIKWAPLSFVLFMASFELPSKRRILINFKQRLNQTICYYNKWLTGRVKRELRSSNAAPHGASVLNMRPSPHGTGVMEAIRQWGG